MGIEARGENDQVGVKVDEGGKDLVAPGAAPLLHGAAWAWMVGYRVRGRMFVGGVQGVELHRYPIPLWLGEPSSKVLEQKPKPSSLCLPTPTLGEL